MRVKLLGKIGGADHHLVDTYTRKRLYVIVDYRLTLDCKQRLWGRQRHRAKPLTLSAGHYQGTQRKQRTDLIQVNYLHKPPLVIDYRKQPYAGISDIPDKTDIGVAAVYRTECLVHRLSDIVVKLNAAYQGTPYVAVGHSAARAFLSVGDYQCHGIARQSVKRLYRLSDSSRGGYYMSLKLLHIRKVTIFP